MTRKGEVEEEMMDGDLKPCQNLREEKEMNVNKGSTGVDSETKVSEGGSLMSKNRPGVSRISLFVPTRVYP